MPILLMWVLVAAVLVPLSGDASDAPGPAATAPLNFVYFGLERSRIAETDLKIAIIMPIMITRATAATPVKAAMTLSRKS